MNAVPVADHAFAGASLSLAQRRQHLIGRIAVARGETRAAAHGVEQALRHMRSATFAGQQVLGLLRPLILTAGVALALKPAHPSRPRGKLVVALIGALSILRAIQRANRLLTPILQLVSPLRK